uniref:Ovule protein n=1 Tax=Strongyloides venezuelensis TaxID=75913 RepID=A0A0K0FQZ0_STRVS
MRKECTLVGHKRRNLQSVYSTLSVLIEDKMLKNIISSGMILIKNWKKAMFKTQSSLCPTNQLVKRQVEKYSYMLVA